jgi:Na+/H+ antiporter NhaD/arsenite permease-like protein
MLKTFIANLADPRHCWLVLPKAWPLAANPTILGSVANLLVVQEAECHGVNLAFGPVDSWVRLSRSPS